MHSVYSVVHLPVIRCWETRTFSYLFIPVFFDTGVLCLLQHLEVAMKAEATAKLTCWCNLLWMTRLQVPTNQLTPLLPLFFTLRYGTSVTVGNLHGRQWPEHCLPTRLGLPWLDGAGNLLKTRTQTDGGQLAFFTGRQNSGVGGWRLGW